MNSEPESHNKTQRSTEKTSRVIVGILFALIAWFIAGCFISAIIPYVIFLLFSDAEYSYIHDAEMFFFLENSGKTMSLYQIKTHVIPKLTLFFCLSSVAGCFFWKRSFKKGFLVSAIFTLMLFILTD